MNMNDVHHSHHCGVVSEASHRNQAHTTSAQVTCVRAAGQLDDSKVDTHDHPGSLFAFSTLLSHADRWAAAAYHRFIIPEPAPGPNGPCSSPPPPATGHCNKSVKYS